MAKPGDENKEEAVLGFQGDGSQLTAVRTEKRAGTWR